MIKNTLWDNRSHSLKSQKHLSGIISIDQKHAGNKKSSLCKNYLSPQQKNSILENGPLILEFVSQKLNIIDNINDCNEKMMIDNYMDEKVRSEIRKIEQNLALIKSDIMQRYQSEVNKTHNCQQLNEAIYSVLNQSSQAHSKIQQSFHSLKQASKIKANQFNHSEQKLKDYFYSFVISLAGTDTNYHHFLDGLYDELFFDDQFSAQKVQKVMTEDTQYCIRILIITLSNKFHKIVKDSKFKENPNVVYFPNQMIFLKLVLNFILTNLRQMTDKMSSFIDKFHQIQNYIKSNTRANEEQTNENFKNTLSRYLPKQLHLQALNAPYYTFSPRDLQNLKHNMIRSYNIKNHIEEWSMALSFFEKIFLKICFNRILSCKRHNFQATQAIFQTIENSKIHKVLVFDALGQIKNFSSQIRHYEKLQIEAQIKFNKYFLKKIFISWKSLKQKKEKLLRVLIKKKTRAQKKEQTLIFNLWRINISRMRISQKILAHSSSCTAVINKFSQDEIQTYEQRKQKKTEQLQKSMYKMSGITLKKSNSYRSGLSQSRMTNNSKPKTSNIYQNPNNQDLKLLNYQYKQSIIEKLNKKSRKVMDKSRQAQSKTSTVIQSKTLLKV